MTQIVADRILESSTTTGVGSYTLDGAVVGYRGASIVCTNGDTFTYYAEDVDAYGRPIGDWETGLGTWSTGNILARTIIYSSSNSNTAVSWAPGTRLIGLSVNSNASFNTLNVINKTNLSSINISTSTSIGLSSTSKLEINEAGARSVVIGRSSVDATGSNINFVKSRSSTYGNRSIVANNDYINIIYYWADDGTDLVQAASISAAIDGSPTLGSMPGRLIFSTTPTGSNLPVEAMRINNAGNVGIGSASIGSSKLTVARADNAPGGIIQLWQADLGVNTRNMQIISPEVDNATAPFIFFTANSFTFRIDTIDALSISSTGGVSVIKTELSGIPLSTDGNVLSGYYTPTLTNGTNVTSSTAYPCQYMRVGNIVTVSGMIGIDPTSNSVNTDILVSLPIASTFAGANQCGGSGGAATTGIYGQSITIRSDIASGKAIFLLTPSSTENAIYNFSFTYRVL